MKKSKDKEPEFIPPPIPEGLSEKSTALWEKFVSGRAKSAGRLVLLEQALRALDRANFCRHKVDEQGVSSKTKSTGAVHLNPLLKAEREFRGQFEKIWSKLALHWDAHIDGGMPNYYSE